MPRIQRLVAVAQDDQYPSRRYPAGHQPEHVDRRLVGPVNVLHHEHRRFARAQLDDQGRSNLVGDRLIEKRFSEPRPDVYGEIANRPERAGREEHIASTS